MDDKQIEDLAERAAQKAADKAVDDVLMKMGINPQNLMEMQQAFMFLKSWQESCKTIRKSALSTAVKVVVVGFIGLIWVTNK